MHHSAPGALAEGRIPHQQSPHEILKLRMKVQQEHSRPYRLSCYGAGELGMLRICHGFGMNVSVITQVRVVIGRIPGLGLCAEC